MGDVRYYAIMPWGRSKISFGKTIRTPEEWIEEAKARKWGVPLRIVKETREVVWSPPQDTA